MGVRKTRAGGEYYLVRAHAPRIVWASVGAPADGCQTVVSVNAGERKPAIASIGHAEVLVKSSHDATPPWKHFQGEIAAFFRELGLAAYEDAEVQGVRTKHMIDVYVVFEFFGVVTRWIVECKSWTRKVPKERVFTLRTIADDVGADRAFLVASKGFQAGAIEAATTTNVTLVTLSDLRERAARDLTDLRLTRLDDRARVVMYRIQRLSIWTQTRHGGSSRVKRGVTAGNVLTSCLGSVSMIRSGIDRIRQGETRVVLPALLEELENEPQVTTDLFTFVAKSDRVLTQFEALVHDQEERAEE